MGTEEAQFEILTAGGGHPVLMVITCRKGEKRTEGLIRWVTVKGLDDRLRNEINKFSDIHVNNMVTSYSVPLCALSFENNNEHHHYCYCQI